MYRSPLAAAFFLRQLQQAGESEGWIVESAGTWVVPGMELPADALEVASQFGFDLKDQVTQVVDQNMLETFDLILVMEKGHKEALGIEFPSSSHKVYLISEVVDSKMYDISDPVTSETGVDEIAEELFGLIERGFRNIVELAQILQNSHI